MRQRDNSEKIAQLNRAKSGYEQSIKNMTDASEADGVDRSGAIGSEQRCIAAIDRQIVDLSPKPEVPAPTEPPPTGIRATGGVDEPMPVATIQPDESSPTK